MKTKIVILFLLVLLAAAFVLTFGGCGADAGLKCTDGCPLADCACPPGTWQRPAD